MKKLLKKKIKLQSENINTNEGDKIKMSKLENQLLSDNILMRHDILRKKNIELDKKEKLLKGMTKKINGLQNLAQNLN